MGSAAGKQIYMAEYLYITYYFHILGKKLPETKGQFIRCTNIKFYQIPPRICASGKEERKTPNT